MENTITTTTTRTVSTLTKLKWKDLVERVINEMIAKWMIKNIIVSEMFSVDWLSKSHYYSDYLQTLSKYYKEKFSWQEWDLEKAKEKCSRFLKNIAILEEIQDPKSVRIKIYQDKTWTIIKILVRDENDEWYNWLYYWVSYHHILLTNYPFKKELLNCLDWNKTIRYDYLYLALCWVLDIL